MNTKTSGIKSIKKGRNNLMKTVGNIHNEVLITSEDLVTSTIKTGEKWQKLMTKAIKNSEPLMEKQSEMIFNSLNTIKGQLKVSSKRVRNLIGWEQKEVDQVIKTTKKNIRNAKNKVAKMVPVKKMVSTVKVTPAPAAKKTTNNDLKAISGIGPKMEEILNSAGIKTYEDLANSSLPTLKKVLENAGSRYKLINPTSWKNDAKTLLAK